jgi:hypothetical protein
MIDRSKKIAAAWNAMDDTTKQSYKEKAKNANEEKFGSTEKFG